MELIQADPQAHRPQQVIDKAAEVFAAGGLVIFPTETVYGIGAAAASDEGYAALRRVKGRPEVQPFTVHAGKREDVLRLVDPKSFDTLRLIRKVLPGPVTIIVDVADDVARERIAAMGLASEVVDRVYNQGTVGLRYPDHPLACAVLAAADSPVLASSANRRGEAPPYEVEQAIEALGEHASLVVDGGRSRYARGSTIIRVTGRGARVKMEIQREGVYDERFIRKLMRWTVLLVCSGNTCRSPMAEAIAKDILAKQRGIKPEELSLAHVQVISAGTSAMLGMRATPEAIEAVQAIGADLSTHRSQPLTPELIHEADIIYCMTQSHLRGVLAMSPDAADKTMLLDEQGDIADPIGQSAAVYRQTAAQIRQNLMKRLKEE